jgi:diguanylate cyclase (GGDEF)-like protein
MIKDWSRPRTVFARFRRWLSGGVRRGLLLGALLAVCVPGVLFLVVQGAVSHRVFDATVEQTKNMIIRLAATALAEPVWTLNADATYAIARVLMDRPAVAAIRVSDGDDRQRVLAFMVRPGVDAAHLESEPGVHSLSEPIHHNGAMIGELTVWFSLTFVELAQQRLKLMLLALVLAQGLVALGVLWWVMNRRVLLPLDRLQAQARQLLVPPAQRQLSAVWRGADELGDLGRNLSRVGRELDHLVAELQRQHEDMKQVAMHDHLTGLPNRVLFLDLCTREIVRCQRDGEQFGLLFIDLDLFKTVNDTHGHPAGDALLIALADRLGAVLRAGDVVARQSGDEFVVLVRQAALPAVMNDVAQRVLSVVEQPFDLGDGVSFAASLSVGGVVYPDHGVALDVLMQHADVAMYRAKAAGRACFRMYDAQLDVAAPLVSSGVPKPQQSLDDEDEATR